MKTEQNPSLAHNFVQISCPGILWPNFCLRHRNDLDFLQDEKNMAEEERNRAKVELGKQEEELDRAQREHDALKSKLVALERKIIVGGENLLEKAEEQVW